MADILATRGCLGLPTCEPSPLEASVSGVLVCTSDFGFVVKNLSILLPLLVLKKVYADYDIISFWLSVS